MKTPSLFRFFEIQIQGALMRHCSGSEWFVRSEFQVPRDEPRGRSSLSLGLVMLLVFGVPLVASAADSKLTYVTPRGVTYTVTAKGLSTIRKGFGSVVDGEWTAFNAESWFKNSGQDEVKTPSPTERSITVLNRKHARVFHAGGDLACTYDYVFENEDLLITARVENHHETASMNVIGFSGLQVHFARTPEGAMVVEQKSHFQEHGLDECHPSRFSPLGGSYAVDREVGIGLSPSNSSLFRTLILWDYADWDEPERDRVLERRPTYFANLPIPPGGAVTVGLTLRVSPELDWKHLLQPYRDSFQKLFGDVQYKTDARWIAVDDLAYVEEKPKSRRSRRGEESPVSNLRGISTSTDAQAVCDLIIPRLDESNGQGVILWGYGLVDGTDETRLANFDVLPPEVEDNWSRLSNQFTAAGLKLGVATSPGKIEVRTGWNEHEFIDSNPRDPAHREILFRRFENMIQRNCSMFFLDSFGGSFDDVILMRWLREKLGPDIQTFADHPSDAMLVYSSGYTGTTFRSGSSAGVRKGYHMQVSEQNWEIFQWLVPGCQLVGQLTEIEGSLRNALGTPERYFYQRKVTPVLSVQDFKRAPALKKLQPQFVNDEHHWQSSQ